MSSSSSSSSSTLPSYMKERKDKYEKEQNKKRKLLEEKKEKKAKKLKILEADLQGEEWLQNLSRGFLWKIVNFLTIRTTSRCPLTANSSLPEIITAIKNLLSRNLCSLSLKNLKKEFLSRRNEPDEYFIKNAKNLLEEEHSNFFFRITSKWLHKKNSCVIWCHGRSKAEHRIKKWISPTCFEVVISDSQNLSTQVKWNKKEMRWLLLEIEYNWTSLNYQILYRKVNQVDFEKDIWEYILACKWDSSKVFRLMPANKKRPDYELFYRDPEAYYNKSTKENFTEMKFMQINIYGSSELPENLMLTKEDRNTSFMFKKSFRPWSKELYLITDGYKLNPYDVFEEVKTKEDFEEVMELAKLNKKEEEEGEETNFHEVFSVSPLVDLISDYLCV